MAIRCNNQTHSTEHAIEHLYSLPALDLHLTVALKFGKRVTASISRSLQLILDCMHRSGRRASV